MRSPTLKGTRVRAGRDLGVLLLLVVCALFIASRCEPQAPASGGANAPHSGCYACHSESEGSGGVHAQVPCQACHLGDTSGANVLSAHAGLEREPGALESAAQTCGSCHAEELERVRGSLMTTGRGLIAVDRWSLLELPHPDSEQSFGELLAQDHPSAAEDHLRRLCAGCHLGTRRQNRDDAIASSEASGCAACHATPAEGGGHVRIEGVVESSRCFGCHSRSARISLSYQGLVEVSGPPAERCEDKRTLHDGRTLCAAEADVHFQAGLGCTDCHLHTELMGDGRAWSHEGEAVEVRCASCHGGDPSLERSWSEVEDDVSRRLLRLRGEQRPAEERVRTGARGTPLWNLRPRPDGGWELRRKSGVGPPISVQRMRAESHRLSGHERLACVACHARSAPRCPTCHTDFEPGGEQWDFGPGRIMPGLFRETSDGVGASTPALGVRHDGRIMPAVPGMIGQLDLREAGGSRVSLRLYSLLDPHTTSARARECVDCHRQSWALGLGTGGLEAEGDSLRFIPLEPSADDANLAADGWTRPGATTPGVSTRRGARSLNASELRRALRVGACLACHPGTHAIYRDFSASVARLETGEAPACALSARPRNSLKPSWF